MASALEIGLAILVLAAATWTIAARDAFAAVIGFVTYGLLLTLVWMSLSSVDVALTEAAIGSGVTGILLLGAAARLRVAEKSMATERAGAAQHLVAAVLSASVTAALAAVVLVLPNPAPTLAPAAEANLPAIGLGNAVTAVLLAYRALDTLLEKAVLVVALIGVWSLTRDHLWGGQPGLRHRANRDDVLVFLAQLLPPVGIVVGIYIVWVGADNPGGAFQGATILAAMWILTIMAGIADPPPISRPWLRLVLVAGPAVFLGVGLAGFVVPGAFLAYPTSFAKELIVGIEAAMTLSIAATLGLLVAGPPERPPTR
ncbi:MAG: hydrogenase subunit MbhD domain-containing protein [Chthoniobacterales bacterium]